MSGKPDFKPNGRHGPKLERRRFDWDDAKRRYLAGETTVDLGREYGVSAVAVGNALKVMGVVPRPHWTVTPYPENLAKSNAKVKASPDCKKGHPWTPETTNWKWSGRHLVRECRQCMRDRQNTRRAQLKARGIKRLKGWHLAKKGELPICRNCGRNDDVQLHHAIPRSKCTATRADLRNGIPLCRGCHHGWHHSRVTIYRDVFHADEWAYISSAELTGENIAAWLDKRYPKRPREEKRAA